MDLIVTIMTAATLVFAGAPETEWLAALPTNAEIAAAVAEVTPVAPSVPPQSPQEAPTATTSATVPDEPASGLGEPVAWVEPVPVEAEPEPPAPEYIYWDAEQQDYVHSSEPPPGFDLLDDDGEPTPEPVDCRDTGCYNGVPMAGTPADDVACLDPDGFVMITDAINVPDMGCVTINP